jgi:hypothetical protein
LTPDVPEMARTAGRPSDDPGGPPQFTQSDSSTKKGTK